MIYLASSSPRRAELLTQIGVKFEVLPVEVNETANAGESAAELVLRLSREKAEEARKQLLKRQLNGLVLASDTLISFQQQVLGKPESRSHCCSMLRQLSGQQHQVLSAVAIINAEDQIFQHNSINEITFRDLSEQEISQYCDSDEPGDKAGSYAIQGRAAVFIKHLSGSYSSVMGLPLFETAQLLQQAGYNRHIS